MNLAANVTFVGLSVVFIALIALSFIIVLFSKLINLRQSIVDRKNHKTSLFKAEDEDSPSKSADYRSGGHEGGELGLDEETVAAITAAIYLCVDCRPGYNLKVKSIKRVPQASSVWSSTGRLEQVTGRL